MVPALPAKHWFVLSLCFANPRPFRSLLLVTQRGGFSDSYQERQGG